MKKPDSEALRARRHRAHSQGDHSLCRPGACPYVDSDGPPKFDMPPEGESVVSAVLAFIDSVPPGREGGPQLVMARCAVRLARAIDGDAPGLPALVGRLGDVMAHIADSQDEDEVDDIRARMHQRRLAILDDAG